MTSQGLNEIQSLWPRQNGCHFADDIFKCVLLHENVWISNTISLKFVPTGPIDNNTALVEIMARHQTGDKPLTEPMMAYFVDTYIRLLTYMHQWIKSSKVQIMACLLFDTKPLHYHIVNWMLRHKLNWNVNQNTNNFFKYSRDPL